MVGSSQGEGEGGHLPQMLHPGSAIVNGKSSYILNYKTELVSIVSLIILRLNLVAILNKIYKCKICQCL